MKTEKVAHFWPLVFLYKSEFLYSSYLNGDSLVLKPWSNDFNFVKEDFTRYPVWVSSILMTAILIHKRIYAPIFRAEEILSKN